MNDSVLPMNVNNFPWLYEDNLKSLDIQQHVGKWMLFYDKSLMNEKWVLAKKLYKEEKLKGVFAMKCSTNYENERASCSKTGVIILYCNNSNDEEKIMSIGRNVLEKFDFRESKMIYYKTDAQTLQPEQREGCTNVQGTAATGSKNNHKYKLFNHLYDK